MSTQRDHACPSGHIEPYGAARARRAARRLSMLAAAVGLVGTCTTSLAQDDEFPDCAMNSPWCKTFYFGVQFLPDYDEADSSLQGFGEQAFFAHFNFDLLRVAEGADHGGFDIRFHSSGAVEAAPGEEGTGGDAPAAGGDRPADRFDAVVGTVDISGYYIFGRTANSQDYPPLEGAPVVEGKATLSHSSYGLKLLAGARSRDGSLENEDTLSAYAAVGFHYGYFDLKPSVVMREEEESKREVVDLIQNRAPTGEFDVGLAFFEEWGGERQRISDAKDLRVLFRGVYNLAGEYYIGVYANGGRGPDEFTVFFGARKSVAELLGFLGLNR